MSILNNKGRYVLENDIKKIIGLEAFKKLVRKGFIKVEGTNITLKVVESRVIDLRA